MKAALRDFAFIAAEIDAGKQAAYQQYHHNA
jgi:hypothetical protein